MYLIVMMLRSLLIWCHVHCCQHMGPHYH